MWPEASRTEPGLGALDVTLPVGEPQRALTLARLRHAVWPMRLSLRAAGPLLVVGAHRNRICEGEIEPHVRAWTLDA